MMSFDSNPYKHNIINNLNHITDVFEAIERLYFLKTLQDSDSLLLHIRMGGNSHSDFMERYFYFKMEYKDYMWRNGFKFHWNTVNPLKLIKYDLYTL